MALAEPLKVTVTGPLSPLEHPVAVELLTENVILLLAPTIVPVPWNGSHCADALADPWPEILLAPMIEGVPCHYRKSS